MDDKRVTMRHIAARAGVHVTTVSLALRNHSSLPVTTRQRLRDLAREMGYRPDPMLSALGVYRQMTKPVSSARTIAYLTFLKTPRIEDHGRVACQFFEGARQRCDELGYRLEHVWMRKPKTVSGGWNKIFQTRNYAGLLVAEFPLRRGHLRLDWSQFVAVKIEQALVFPRLHLVGNNQHQIAQVAMRQAHRMGYSRIGLAISQANNETVNRFWSAGFWAEQQGYPEKNWVKLHLPRDFTFVAFQRWLEKERPDMVLSNLPEKILDWLHRLGKRIPDDIGFIDLDLDRSGNQRAGMLQNHASVGAAAVSQLNILIQHNERGIPEVPQLTLLEGKWIDGDTARRQSRGGATGIAEAGRKLAGEEADI